VEDAMIQVSQKVYEGLEAVRQSGRTNMLDVPVVIYWAEVLGYQETANWIRQHRNEYAKGVFEGFEAKP